MEKPKGNTDMRQRQYLQQAGTGLGTKEAKERSQSCWSLEAQRKDPMELRPRPWRGELLGWCWCLRGVRRQPRRTEERMTNWLQEDYKQPGKWNQLVLEAMATDKA